jgi:hypothetical protein
MRPEKGEREGGEERRPEPTEPAGVGGEGELLAESPDLPVDLGPDLLEEPEDDMAMNEFIKRLNNPVGEEDENDDGNMLDDEYEADDHSYITVTAQALPLPMDEPTATPPMSRPPRGLPKDIEEKPDVPAMESGPERKEPTTSKEESVDVSGVTTSDVIAKLETVSNILNNREIPRQLALIDLMMDSLGVASYFPTLAEATRSALESNQYMSTRIDDILSRFRGSLEPPAKEKIELTSPVEKERGGAEESALENVRKSLSDEERKEKELRERRKERRDLKEQPPGAERESAERRPAPKELAGPVEVEKAKPIPIPRTI